MFNVVPYVFLQQMLFFLLCASTPAGTTIIIHWRMILDTCGYLISFYISPLATLLYILYSKTEYEFLKRAVAATGQLLVRKVNDINTSIVNFWTLTTSTVSAILILAIVSGHRLSLYSKWITFSLMATLGLLWFYLQHLLIGFFVRLISIARAFVTISVQVARFSGRWILPLCFAAIQSLLQDIRSGKQSWILSPLWNFSVWLTHSFDPPNVEINDEEDGDADGEAYGPEFSPAMQAQMAAARDLAFHIVEGCYFRMTERQMEMDLSVIKEFAYDQYDACRNAVDRRLSHQREWSNFIQRDDTGAIQYHSLFENSTWSQRVLENVPAKPLVVPLGVSVIAETPPVTPSSVTITSPGPHDTEPTEGPTLPPGAVSRHPSSAASVPLSESSQPSTEVLVPGSQGEMEIMECDEPGEVGMEDTVMLEQSALPFDSEAHEHPSVGSMCIKPDAEMAEQSDLALSNYHGDAMEKEFVLIPSFQSPTAKSTASEPNPDAEMAEQSDPAPSSYHGETMEVEPVLIPSFQTAATQSTATEPNPDVEMALAPSSTETDIGDNKVQEQSGLLAPSPSHEDMDSGLEDTKVDATTEEQSVLALCSPALQEPTIVSSTDYVEVGMDNESSLAPSSSINQLGVIPDPTPYPDAKMEDEEDPTPSQPAYEEGLNGSTAIGNGAEFIWTEQEGLAISQDLNGFCNSPSNPLFNYTGYPDNGVAAAEQSALAPPDSLYPDIPPAGSSYSTYPEVFGNLPSEPYPPFPELQYTANSGHGSGVFTGLVTWLQSEDFGTGFHLELDPLSTEQYLNAGDDFSLPCIPTTVPQQDEFYPAVMSAVGPPDDGTIDPNLLKIQYPYVCQPVPGESMTFADPSDDSNIDPWLIALDHRQPAEQRILVAPESLVDPAMSNDSVPSNQPVHGTADTAADNGRDHGSRDHPDQIPWAELLTLDELEEPGSESDKALGELPS